MLEHAVKRFLERYGMPLTQELHDNIVKSIETGGAKRIGRRRKDTVGYVGTNLTIGLYFVIYKETTRQLVTFLAPQQEVVRKRVGGDNGNRHYAKRNPRRSEPSEYVHRNRKNRRKGNS